MKRLLSLALFAVLATTAVSCTDATGPGAAVAGTYTLRSVNGITPPFVVQQSAGYTLEVVSGQIVLDANGNYRGTTRYRETTTGSQPTLYDDVITGYWTLSGNQISLTDQNYPNDPYIGTASGNSITLVDYSTGTTYTEVYSK